MAQLSRRQFFKGVLALAAASPLLACGEQDDGAPSGSASGETLGTAEQPVTTAVIVSPGLLFDVTTIYVPVGKPVRFTYRNEHEGVPHNFHVAGDGVDAATTLRSGPDVQDVTVSFSAEGEYGYICDAHPSMTGVVRAV